MKTVEKTVRVDISLGDFTDEELLEECAERGILPDKEIDYFSDEELRSEYSQRFHEIDVNVTIERIYEEFRRRGDCPPVLREFIYDQIGRTL